MGMFLNLVLSGGMAWRIIVSPLMKEYKVGQTIMVTLSGGRIVEAQIKAIGQTTDGPRLNIAFGSEAAVIYEWPIVDSK
jgi:hypothetical protein